MPMLAPIRTITETATDRTNLSSALSSLQTAITTQESLFTGASPALPVPSELTDITTAITNVDTELATLSGAGYTPEGIRECRDNIRDLCKMVKKAESKMDPFRVEYRQNVVETVVGSVEEHNKALMTQALGGKIRRNTARIVNTRPVQAVAEHKGKIAGAVGAGAILYGVLQMDGCSPSREMPPTGSKKPTSGEYHPINKRDSSGGKEYDANGQNFSVGGFLNASKTTFGNGSSPEAQAFQGVWNYIDEHLTDDKLGFGERFHFHTTPNKSLTDATHFDVNAYTGDHDTKVIEITWQKEHGTERRGIPVEQLNNHTWRYTMESNGSITKYDVWHDGRGTSRLGIINKAQFQEDLRKVQGF